jgi:hypothetical protein
MKTLHMGFALAAALAITGCSKKDNAASGDKAPAAAADKPAGGAETAKSGLAWTPENYGEMSEKCKKALACCEEVAKGEGAKSAEDFNGKCSGPAMWKDDECEMDLKSRASEGKPLPDACK